MISDRAGLSKAVGERERIIPMLGPNSHFSAGVSIGHFKTSLRRLRAEASAQRDRAKRAGGRRAGVTWFTRSGPKARAVLALDAGVPGSVGQVSEWARRFREGRIPGRLPYKLRAVGAIAQQAAGMQNDEATALVRGLVRSAVEGELVDAEAIADAWLAALRVDADRRDEHGGLEFLLLARALSGQLSEHKEVP